MSLTSELREYARAAGIDLLGVTSARTFLVGEERRMVNPQEWLAGAEALVVAACYTYRGPRKKTSPVPGRPRGKVGCYSATYRAARHYSERLISEYLTSAGCNAAISNKIPFKMAAVRSGIAYYGKNCLVHADGFGSYLELGCVITNAPLETVDESTKKSDCGDCTACMDGCPSGAIDRPYHVVRDQCMGRWLGDGLPIPPEFRERVGVRILRCDACHAVCPMNRGLTPRENAPFEVRDYEDSPELIPLLLGDEEYYRKVLPGFDVYANVDVLHRNVAIALGNAGDPAAIPPLIQASRSEHPEVREAALWALTKIKSDQNRPI